MTLGSKKGKKGSSTKSNDAVAQNKAKTKEGQKKAFEKYIRSVTSPKERDYVRSMLEEFVKNNVLPIDLLDHIPRPPEEIGKTRFDQLYDAAMYLTFPGYRDETLQKLLGPTYKDRPNTKIFRCIYPEKFGLTHVLIRASSLQEAFALATDYACRLSLKAYHKIPNDLTVRVMFVSEKAVRRMLDMRWANRVKKRKTLQLEGRSFTTKEVTGAKLVALGHDQQSEFSIFKYAEARDLRKILKQKDKMRISSVETETFRELPDEIKYKAYANESDDE